MRTRRASAFGGAPARLAAACLLPLLVMAAMVPIVARRRLPPPRPDVRPAPIFGVTVDSIRDIGSIVAAERALPDRPTTRVYMSTHEPASYYAGAVLSSTRWAR